MPTLLIEAEGNTGHGVNRKSCLDPARSETLRMPGSLLHGSWEISSAPAAVGRAGQGRRIAAILPSTRMRSRIRPNEAAEQRGIPSGGGRGKGCSCTSSSAACRR